MTNNKRINLPAERAARALFLSDRICCVCRNEGKPVQIHHIDENPGNNDLANLAVLCLGCHNETQLRGGFARKLDADQIVLYRDDWHRIVARTRASAELSTGEHLPARERIALALSIAEIYRENEEFELLAMHYDSLGNVELRDKYIELALKQNPTDSSIAYLRGIQKRLDAIPPEVVERELARYAKHDDKLQRARFLEKLGRHRDAVLDYVEGIAGSLKEQRLFAAAYYLKELAESGLVTELFVEALGEFTASGDLWWQIRALQELGWDKELKDLLLRNIEEIEKSGNLMMQMLLAEAQGQETKAAELQKQLAASATIKVFDDEEQPSEDE